jgi:hypothetical protein
VRIRGVPVRALAEAGARLLGPAIVSPRRRLPGLIGPSVGRKVLSLEERRMAVGVDAALRRLGVRCLRRSLIVTDMLRRRGVAAQICLSVAGAAGDEAHAEVEVGGVPLRPTAPGWVTMR